MTGLPPGADRQSRAGGARPPPCSARPPSTTSTSSPTAAGGHAFARTPGRAQPQRRDHGAGASTATSRVPQEPLAAGARSGGPSRDAPPLGKCGRVEAGRKNGPRRPAARPQRHAVVAPRHERDPRTLGRRPRPIRRRGLMLVLSSPSGRRQDLDLAPPARAASRSSRCRSRSPRGRGDPASATASTITSSIARPI